jgi:hypothetical protein
MSVFKLLRMAKHTHHDKSRDSALDASTLAAARAVQRNAAAASTASPAVDAEWAIDTIRSLPTLPEEWISARHKLACWPR